MNGTGLRPTLAFGAAVVLACVPVAEHVSVFLALGGVLLAYAMLSVAVRVEVWMPGDDRMMYGRAAVGCGVLAALAVLLPAAVPPLGIGVAYSVAAASTNR